MALSTNRTLITQTGINTHQVLNVGGLDSAGIATFSNFKTGSTNVHSVGVEAAGINVLGGDTPIGAGSTIFDDGGARFIGIVTASGFSGDGSSLTGVASTDNIKTSTTANFTGGIQVGGSTTLTGALSATTVTSTTATANLVVVGSAVTSNSQGIDVTGIVTATSFKGDGSSLTGIDATQIATGNTKVQTVASRIDSKIANVGILTVTAAGANVTGIVTASSFSGGGLGKLLKIHYAETTTSTLVTTPTRADTTLAITFTPEALGSTFFVQAFQYGLNGVSSDQALFNLYLMRAIAGGTASEIQSNLYMGNYTTNDRAYWKYLIGYKDNPSYSAGQTINYHIEVGFYTGNYALNFRAQANSVTSQIFVYELGA